MRKDLNNAYVFLIFQKFILCQWHRALAPGFPAHSFEIYPKHGFSKAFIHTRRLGCERWLWGWQPPLLTSSVSLTSPPLGNAAEGTACKPLLITLYVYLSKIQTEEAASTSLQILQACQRDSATAEDAWRLVPACRGGRPTPRRCREEWPLCTS